MAEWDEGNDVTWGSKRGEESDIMDICKGWGSNTKKKRREGNKVIKGTTKKEGRKEGRKEGT
jgi:hypothetical protein